jgi:hypothetical protein
MHAPHIRKLRMFLRYAVLRTVSLRFQSEPIPVRQPQGSEHGYARRDAITAGDLVDVTNSDAGAVYRAESQISHLDSRRHCSGVHSRRGSVLRGWALW